MPKYDPATLNIKLNMKRVLEADIRAAEKISDHLEAARLTNRLRAVENEIQELLEERS